jgi:hypothetical protein
MSKWKTSRRKSHVPLVIVSIPSQIKFGLVLAGKSAQAASFKDSLLKKQERAQTNSLTVKISGSRKTMS